MSRRSVVAVAAAVAVLIALAAAFQLAVGELRRGIEQALGPRASVGSLRAGWSGIELHDVRIRAMRSGRAPWPAEDELRAARIRVVPALSSLWSDGWHVHSVTVKDGYVSVLRARDGRLRVLPSLLGGREPSGPAARVLIRRVRLEDAAVDFHDATVRQPPHRMRLERLQAEVGPLALPALDTAMAVDLQGTLKGPQRDGRLAVSGSVAPATRDAKIDARVVGVDLVALQPYLLRASEGGVERGTLDLELAARVTRNRLHAPGTLTLADVRFKGGSGLATFAGVPRQAVLAALTRDGQVQVRFTLEGRLDDPTFSLNESLAVRIAGGIAQALGVSVGGVVDGVGSMIRGLFGR